MNRIEVNVMTGEIAEIELTQDEVAAMQASADESVWQESNQQEAAIVDPVDKLKAFLAANPDVAALVK